MFTFFCGFPFFFLTSVTYLRIFLAFYISFWTFVLCNLSPTPFMLPCGCRAFNWIHLSSCGNLKSLYLRDTSRCGLVDIHHVQILYHILLHRHFFSLELLPSFLRAGLSFSPYISNIFIYPLLFCISILNLCEGKFIIFVHIFYSATPK